MGCVRYMVLGITAIVTFAIVGAIVGFENLADGSASWSVLFVFGAMFLADTAFKRFRE